MSARSLVRRWPTLIVGALAGLLLIGYGVLPAARAVQVAHPPRTSACCRTPADYGLTFEDVVFTTERGVSLRGWYVPSRNRAAVVIAHGFGGNRAETLDPAATLARQGFGVLAIDLLAHGESGGDRLCLDGQDVLAAVAYLQARPDVDATRIGVWGFSLGGLVSIQAAAQTEAIAAVAADGPLPVVTLPDFPPPESVADALWIPFDGVQIGVLGLQGVSARYAVIDALPRIAPRPVLLIAGIQNDGERRAVRKYYAAAGKNAALWEIPEAGHLGGWTARRAEYAERIGTFFTQSLRVGTAHTPVQFASAQPIARRWHRLEAAAIERIPAGIAAPLVPPDPPRSW